MIYKNVKKVFSLKEKCWKILKRTNAVAKHKKYNEYYE